ncbi:MAG: hypothetical protein B9S38_01875 [Verrucomicrobiia bacterium Tous-C4TDCM]|nr:MAG: hypothetical protein B9S38_01875 [Verrucomicrobiae bacterium Tous-C4TDCM]
MNRAGPSRTPRHESKPLPLTPRLPRSLHQGHRPPDPAATERCLFADGIYYHPGGKAKLLFSEPSELPESPDDTYPFLLLTGRSTSSQWHTQTRTGRSAILRKLYPAGAYVEIHPDDAGQLGIGEGSRVALRSRRGQMTAAAYLAPTVQPGHLFLPMHYPEVNRLTHPSFDPHSRQPNYKACAATITLA